jgi:hypothetical protein
MARRSNSEFVLTMHLRVANGQTVMRSRLQSFPDWLHHLVMTSRFDIAPHDNANRLAATPEAQGCE